MGEPRQRVTFRFAGRMEVQYLTGLPVVGDRVSHEGQLWVVTRVEFDRVGPLVVCSLRATNTQAAGGTDSAP